VNRLIPHFVSHFETVVVTGSLWRSYCFVQRWPLSEQMAHSCECCGMLEVLADNPDDGVNAVSAAFVDERPNPEESCWRREGAELVTEAINGLGPKIQSTILLRYIEERSAEETALILGTSITAAKARVFQGHRKLRETLNSRVVWEVYAAGPAEARHRCT
jgi:hypothetical protein